ncbi:hypothetical protein ACC724_39905, partial [Rhizobium ruizarguesonis]
MLDGKAGADILIGGVGNDTRDRIVEIVTERIARKRRLDQIGAFIQSFGDH